MKKVLTLSMAMTMAIAASAADVTVYNNGSLAPGIASYGWWNDAVDYNAANPTGGDTKVFSFKAADGGAAASMGLFANGQEFKTGALHSANLTFSWYTTTTAKYTVRLTADGLCEQDYAWEVAEADLNKWNETSLPIATQFPNVAKGWEDFAGKGAGYVFAIILDNGVAESVIYFDNIRYTNIDESWEAPEVAELIPPTTVPAVTQSADDVISVLSPYGHYSFNFGWWGQSTQTEFVTIDNTEVLKMTSFNYLGFELNPAINLTDYQHMHVDFYTCEETGFGFTPISPGQERGWIAPEVKVNEWNSYDVPLSYFSNVDFSNVFQIKFDQGTKVECYLANVYFWKEEQGEVPPVTPGATYTGTVSGSVEQTFEGTTTTYPYVLTYKVVYNEDKTLTISADYNFTDGEPFGAIAGTVYIDNQGFDMQSQGNLRVVTTTATYEPREVLSIRFYIPAGAGTIYQDEFEYTVGSENISTGVETIATAGDDTVFYTLQGVRVANPEKGLYIMVRGGKATKVML